MDSRLGKINGRELRNHGRSCADFPHAGRASRCRATPESGLVKWTLIAIVVAFLLFFLVLSAFRRLPGSLLQELPDVRQNIHGPRHRERRATHASHGGDRRTAEHDLRPRSRLVGHALFHFKGRSFLVTLIDLPLWVSPLSRRLDLRARVRRAGLDASHRPVDT